VAEPGADAPRASGTLERHYAPRTPLEVVPVDRLGSRLAALFHLRVAVLAPAAVLQTLRAQPAVEIPASEDPATFARELYADLHQLDQAAADRIVVAAPPAGTEWTAVHDRLQRAQAGSRPR
jgi:L-threonylcarbamoyladenylate synthase